MSFLSEITSAIGRLERALGLKNDYGVDTIYSRINALETQAASGRLIHPKSAGSEVIPANYNVVYTNEVEFLDITIEDGGTLIIIE